MSILLAASALGIASCWLQAIDRARILALFGDIDPARYQLHSVIALGYPAMSSRVVEMEGDSTDYFLEAPGKLCVPKRSAENIERWYE